MVHAPDRAAPSMGAHGPAGKPATGAPGAREQMRARYPDATGFVERNGVRVGYEVYGHGEPTVLLVPTWHIVHSRLWKAQIPYLARDGRVVTFDPRGNGTSDRPNDSAAYSEREIAADILAVMDATATDRAMLVTLSLGAQRGLIVAGEHPDRVAGFVAIGPSLPIGERLRTRRQVALDAIRGTDAGWAKYDPDYWRRDLDGFLQFFFSQCFTEPHSTKQIEDCVGWGHEIGAEPLILGEASAGLTADETLALAARVRCPVLVIVGDGDAITGAGPAIALAKAIPQAQMLVIEGGGHIPDARDPVLVNLAIRDFAAAGDRPAIDASSAGRGTGRTWTRGLARRRRALYISSPIGLGHAQRDVAIAAELRKLHPDLQIDWLAQSPVTNVLEAHGERIHPLSAELALESAHITAESSEHDLNAFQAIRADGRDPRRELHGVPRCRGDRRLRPRDRGRGLGHRLLPPREPGAQADGIRVDDRFRRLAADAVGR